MQTLPGGFAVDLAAAFGLALGLALAAGLAPSLPSALAAFSGQGALPALGSQRLLAQLLVVGEGAGVALRTVPVVAEVEADLTCRSLPATLGARTGRQGAVLGRRARRPGRGCLGSRLELGSPSAPLPRPQRGPKARLPW